MGCWDGFMDFLHKVYAGLLALFASILYILFIVGGASEIKDEGQGLPHRHMPFIVAILFNTTSIVMYIYSIFADLVPRPLIYFSSCHFCSVASIIFTGVACGVCGRLVDACYQEGVTKFQEQCKWSSLEFAAGVLTIGAQMLIYIETKRKLMKTGEEK
eukprot:PhF_6_TR30592/c0_g1_i1/m.45015